MASYKSEIIVEGDILDDSKYLLKNFYKVLRMILKKIDVSEVRTILSGICEKHNIIIIISKKTILFFDRAEDSLFPGKIVLIPKEKMRGYTFLHEKGEDYLQSVFSYNNTNYNLKIRIVDVKTPKFKLDGEKVNSSQNIDELFKNGKIDYRKLGEPGEEEPVVQRKNPNKRHFIIYAVIVFALIDLIFTFILIYAFTRLK